jgi:hypothetical protein
MLVVSMPSLLRPAFSLLAAAALLAPASSAFDAPLSPEAVRDAYFLGQHNDQSTLSFFSQYVRSLPAPDKGPYIAEVEFYTPYTQIVEASRRRTGSYSAQQAELDYRRHHDKLYVRVRIDFTDTYGIELYRSAKGDKQLSGRDEPLPDFYRDFRVASRSVPDPPAKTAGSNPSTSSSNPPTCKTQTTTLSSLKILASSPMPPTQAPTTPIPTPTDTPIPPAGSSGWYMTPATSPPTTPPSRSSPPTANTSPPLSTSPACADRFCAGSLRNSAPILITNCKAAVVWHYFCGMPFNVFAEKLSVTGSGGHDARSRRFD